MAYKQRFLRLLVLIALELLYFPINRFQQGGVVVKLPIIDNLIPLWKVWVIPYALWAPVWVGAFIWSAWKMDERLYRAFFTGALVTIVAGMSTFLFFPTYMERPVLVGNDFLTEMLRFIYNNDRLYNAFPSAHVYIVATPALFWSIWYPRWRWLWVSIVVVIALATVFTGQHFILDPIGGVLYSLMGYYVSMWWMKRRYGYNFISEISS